MIKGVFLGLLSLALGLLLLFITPSNVKARVDIDVNTCTTTFLSNSSECTVKVAGDDSEIGRAVTIELLRGEKVAVYKSKDCALEKKADGKVSCQVKFTGVDIGLFIDKPVIVVKDKNTGEVLATTKKDKKDGEGTSGKNPCDTDGDGILEPDEKCPTAIGNIPTDIQGFAGRILQIAIGLAGGLALILMVIGSIRVLTSSGDQQRLAAGRDMIVAAVAGLLFLIFSVLILKFIGISLLGNLNPFT